VLGALLFFVPACALDASGLGPRTDCSEDADCTDFPCGDGRCVAGTCAAPEVPCDDGLECTDDRCAPGAPSCTHTPAHDACAEGEICDLARGCVTAPCEDAADCDDGLVCDGAETCFAGSCRPGEPIACEDSVDCTSDTCTEPAGTCVSTPDDAACGDDLWCNGVDRCDAATGCTTDAPPDCSDGVDCTLDACDEAADLCTNAPPDVDGDGHGILGCAAGDDCDDARADVHPDARDVPGGEDLDCDGFDFDDDRSVFVSPGGDDAGAGTRADPLETLAAALALADAGGFDFVIADAGDYAGSIDLVADVSMYGGFEWDGVDGWLRPDGLSSRILGGPIPVRAIDVLVPTTLDRFGVEAADGAAAGESSIGLLAVRSSGVTLVDVSITAGRGHAGANGRPGANGVNGANGTNAANGAAGGAGGGGGASACGAAGGGGGDGGVGLAADGADGGDGSGAGGGSGGAGGNAIVQDGGDGSAGTLGASGPAGAAGAGECLATDVPSGCDGGDGADGEAGGGGGGGGGGLGGLDFPDDLAGGGGGGGGSGGCPGIGGGGGQGGGGSWAIHATDTPLHLERVSLAVGGGGDGGNGARGGAGATGGAGSNGGTGASGCPDSAAGGGGAAGGASGSGGPGAGGAGGPSWCLVRVGGDRSGDDPTCVPVRGGAGGAGASMAGGPTAPDGEAGSGGTMDES